MLKARGERQNAAGRTQVLLRKLSNLRELRKEPKTRFIALSDGRVTGLV